MTEVQHVRGGGREGTEVWDVYRMGFWPGDLRARGSGSFGTVWGDCKDGQGGGFGGSLRFVRLCHIGWCLIMVPVCRCGGDLLGFGSSRAIALLEQAVRINWASAGKPVGGGRWGAIWAGGVRWKQCLWSGSWPAASWERGGDRVKIKLFFLVGSNFSRGVEF